MTNFDLILEAAENKILNTLLDDLILEAAKKKNITTIEEIESIIDQTTSIDKPKAVQYFFNYCSILTSIEKEYLKLKYC